MIGETRLNRRSSRNPRLRGRHVSWLAGAALLAAPLPLLAAEPTLQAAVAGQASGELASYYAYEAGPLWVAADGTLDPAAEVLVRLIETADLDGLDPRALAAGELRASIERARHDRSQAALAEAEVALSSALTHYADALSKQAGGSAMIYEHDVLRPITPSAFTVMRAAAAAPSLTEYVRQMGWMHPLYGELRLELLGGDLPPAVRQSAIATLQRLRDLPVPPGRHVLLDVASARLWMYEDGQPVGSMKVVVGKPETPTPIMAGYIRYATLNPYWTVPRELLRTTIANGVLGQGVAYLKTRGYQVFESWEDDAAELDPKTVDWKAVKRGELDLRVRQKPSRANSMGNVKYEFPNPQGIYLHDTPSKQLMDEAVRQLSNGCVRLEDAERLGQWLLGGDLPREGAGPEHRVNLAEPVPIYITYLTAVPEGETIAVRPDLYELDAAGGPTLAHAP